MFSRPRSSELELWLKLSGVWHLIGTELFNNFQGSVFNMLFMQKSLNVSSFLLFPNQCSVERWSKSAGGEANLSGWEFFCLFALFVWSMGLFGGVYFSFICSWITYTLSLWIEVFIPDNQFRGKRAVYPYPEPCSGTLNVMCRKRAAKEFPHSSV